MKDGEDLTDASMNVLSVFQLNTYIKALIDGDINLSVVVVVGEISNFTNHYKSGHFYFTLKDEKSSIKAVMFKNANLRLKFLPENGMRVICFGRVSVFERDGQYQLYVESIQPDGLGSLSLMFEQLRDKLEGEGLFAQEKKKNIPFIPERVGVITSATGAAFRDIVNVISRRFPLCEIIFAPAQVQGENSSESMINALLEFERKQCADVIIIGRGGGSMEDLWCFNDEKLARTVASMTIPIISAVGHETDYTIIDFVSDLRAPTPSAAAELAVPDIDEMLKYIYHLLSLINGSLHLKIENEKSKIMSLLERSKLRQSDNYLDIQEEAVLQLTNRVYEKSNSLIDDCLSKVNILYNKLDALSPIKVLLRGYAIVTKDSKTVKSINDVKENDNIDIIIHDGKINCMIKKTEKER